MTISRKRLLGPAAVSVAALASLTGAPSANAQDEPPVFCEICGDLAAPGLLVAFHKLEDKAFPGKVEFAFLKIGSGIPEFGK